MTRQPVRPTLLRRDDDQNPDDSARWFGVDPTAEEQERATDPSKSQSPPVQDAGTIAGEEAAPTGADGLPPRQPGDPPSMGQRALWAAALMDILSEVDPQGLMADGQDEEVYRAQAEYLSWGVLGAEEQSSDDLLADVCRAFGYEDETPSPELLSAFSEIAERMLADCS
jgi:hypothetical protein